VVGIDLSWPALEFCRRRGESALAQASVLALPLASASFDLVVCNDVIQHLPGKDGDLAALGEFRRVLRPGGHLLVRTNSSWGLDEATDDDYRRYRLDELRARVRGAGFEVLRATYANALPSLVGAARRRLRPGPRHAGPHRHNPGLGIRLLPAHLSWLNTSLHWLMKGEAWLLARPAAALSFGHTIFFLARRPEDA
jgi:SAM-dependent methyltransferase